MSGNLITIKLGVKTIMFDIQNTTHLTGVSRKADEPGKYEATAHMQASGDENHSAKIRRSVSTAFAQIKTELSEYLNESQTTSNNKVKDEIKNDGVLELVFDMPGNFQQSAVDGIGMSLHNYIVNRSISEWFGITNPNEVKYYSDMAQVSLEEARKSLYNRKAPQEPDETFS